MKIRVSLFVSLLAALVAVFIFPGWQVILEEVFEPSPVMVHLNEKGKGSAPIEVKLACSYYVGLTLKSNYSENIADLLGGNSLPVFSGSLHLEIVNSESLGVFISDLDDPSWPTLWVHSPESITIISGYVFLDAGKYNANVEFHSEAIEIDDFEASVGLFYHPKSRCFMLD